MPFQLTKVLSNKSALPATKSGNLPASASTTIPELFLVGCGAIGNSTFVGSKSFHPSGSFPASLRVHSANSVGYAVAYAATSWSHWDC